MSVVYNEENLIASLDLQQWPGLYLDLAAVSISSTARNNHLSTFLQQAQLLKLLLLFTMYQGD